MNYDKTLPRVSELRRLSENIDDFPMTISHVIRIAETLGYSRSVISFLRLFHGEFESRSDFYSRTSELILLIREEEKQPDEPMLSPQG